MNHVDKHTSWVICIHLFNHEAEIADSGLVKGHDEIPDHYEAVCKKCFDKGADTVGPDDVRVVCGDCFFQPKVISTPTTKT